MARYYETLSMDGVSSFLENIASSQDVVDEIAVESENNVKGYKILKITGSKGSWYRCYRCYLRYFRYSYR